MFGLHHYQKRQKTPDTGEFPTRRSVAQAAVDLLVYPAAILSPLALLPQAWALFATRDAQGLALLTWLTFAAVNLIWIAYGRAHEERPIVLANAASLILNGIIAFGILLYR